MCNVLISSLNLQHYNKPNLIEQVESSVAQNCVSKLDMKAGDVVRLVYKIQEGKKERLQTYEGLIIAMQNRGLGKTFTMRRNVQGIGVEQIFLINSPRILSLLKLHMSKVRKAKLFFVRQLNTKTIRLKMKTK